MDSQTLATQYTSIQMPWSLPHFPLTASHIPVRLLVVGPMVLLTSTTLVSFFFYSTLVSRSIYISTKKKKKFVLVTNISYIGIN